MGRFFYVKDKKAISKAVGQRNAELNIAHAVYESDVMYLINTFYEDDNGVVRQNSIGRSILYKATAKGKTVYATDVYGHWGVYNPVDKTWVSVPTPHISAKPLVYSSGVKTNESLNELLSTNTNYVPMDVNTIQEGAIMIDDYATIRYSVQGQMGEILSKFNNDNQASVNLFNKLVSLNPEQKLFILNNSNAKDSGLADVGMFFEATNEVKVNVEDSRWYATPLELINHELIHTVTRDVINTGKYDEQISALADKLLNTLPSIYSQINDDLADRIMYAYGNQHELLTVTLAENQVKDALPSELVKELNELFGQIVGEFHVRLNHTQRTNATQISSAGVSQTASKQQATQRTNIDESNQSSKLNQANPSADETSDGSVGAIRQRTKGFKDLEVEQQEQSNTNKTFTINDIKKAVAAREKTQAVGALFDAYMGVVEKRYPDLSLTFATGVDYMAKYHNNQITINKDVWDNPDITPNKFNGLCHSHNCWVLLP
ncbi:hypothetical protein LU290_07845 [Moraxella nasibovis]|uniref:hypothetical protein n=1 Tax=Moraxella nasibovis TaxID=2904120 RepID=UPI00240F3A06|nr:hypothetical protein [Moraxella nasibovis]WFF38163.1 hypothetical protein LU290_07845 [Moraxella nasibovis]